MFDLVKPAALIPKPEGKTRARQTQHGIQARSLDSAHGVLVECTEVLFQFPYTAQSSLSSWPGPPHLPGAICRLSASCCSEWKDNAAGKCYASHRAVAVSGCQTVTVGGNDVAAELGQCWRKVPVSRTWEGLPVYK